MSYCKIVDVAGNTATSLDFLEGEGLTRQDALNTYGELLEGINRDDSGLLSQELKEPSRSLMRAVVANKKDLIDNPVTNQPILPFAPNVPGYMPSRNKSEVWSEDSSGNVTMNMSNITDNHHISNLLVPFLPKNYKSVYSKNFGSSHIHRVLGILSSDKSNKIVQQHLAKGIKKLEAHYGNRMISGMLTPDSTVADFKKAMGQFHDTMAISPAVAVNTQNYLRSINMKKAIKPSVESDKKKFLRDIRNDHGVHTENRVETFMHLNGIAYTTGAILKGSILGSMTGHITKGNTMSFMQPYSKDSHSTPYKEFTNEDGKKVLSFGGFSNSNLDIAQQPEVQAAMNLYSGLRAAAVRGNELVEFPKEMESVARKFLGPEVIASTKDSIILYAYEKYATPFDNINVRYTPKGEVDPLYISLVDRMANAAEATRAYDFYRSADFKSRYGDWELYRAIKNNTATAEQLAKFQDLYDGDTADLYFSVEDIVDSDGYPSPKKVRQLLQKRELPLSVPADLRQAPAVKSNFTDALITQGITRIRELAPGVDIQIIDDPYKDFSGKLENGTIYINKALASADTPFHELGHIVYHVLSNQNPKLLQEINDLVESTGIDTHSLPYAEAIEEKFVDLLGKKMADMDNGQSLFRKIMQSVYTALNNLFGTTLFSQGNNSVEKKLNHLVEAVADSTLRGDFKSQFNSRLLRNAALGIKYQKVPGTTDTLQGVAETLTGISSKKRLINSIRNSTFGLKAKHNKDWLKNGYVYTRYQKEPTMHEESDLDKARREMSNESNKIAVPQSILDIKTKAEAQEAMVQYIYDQKQEDKSTFQRAKEIVLTYLNEEVTGDVLWQDLNNYFGEYIPEQFGSRTALSQLFPEFRKGTFSKSMDGEVQYESLDSVVYDYSSEEFRERFPELYDPALDTGDLLVAMHKGLDENGVVQKWFDIATVNSAYNMAPTAESVGNAKFGAGLLSTTQLQSLSNNKSNGMFSRMNLKANDHTVNAFKAVSLGMYFQSKGVKTNRFTMYSSSTGGNRQVSPILLQNVLPQFYELMGHQVVKDALNANGKNPLSFMYNDDGSVNQDRFDMYKLSKSYVDLMMMEYQQSRGISQVTASGEVKLKPMVWGIKKGGANFNNQDSNHLYELLSSYKKNSNPQNLLDLENAILARMKKLNYTKSGYDIGFDARANTGITDNPIRRELTHLMELLTEIKGFSREGLNQVEDINSIDRWLVTANRVKDPYVASFVREFDQRQRKHIIDLKNKMLSLGNSFEDLVKEYNDNHIRTGFSATLKIPFSKTTSKSKGQIALLNKESGPYNDLFHTNVAVDPDTGERITFRENRLITEEDGEQWDNLSDTQKAAVKTAMAELKEAVLRFVRVDIAKFDEYNDLLTTEDAQILDVVEQEAERIMDTTEGISPGEAKEKAYVEVAAHLIYRDSIFAKGYMPHVNYNASDIVINNGPKYIKSAVKRWWEVLNTNALFVDSNMSEKDMNRIPAYYILQGLDYRHQGEGTQELRESRYLESHGLVINEDTGEYQIMNRKALNKLISTPNKNLVHVLGMVHKQSMDVHHYTDLLPMWQSTMATLQSKLYDAGLTTMETRRDSNYQKTMERFVEGVLFGKEQSLSEDELGLKATKILRFVGDIVSKSVLGFNFESNIRNTMSVFTQMTSDFLVEPGKQKRYKTKDIQKIVKDFHKADIFAIAETAKRAGIIHSDPFSIMQMRRTNGEDFNLLSQKNMFLLDKLASDEAARVFFFYLQMVKDGVHKTVKMDGEGNYVYDKSADPRSDKILEDIEKGLQVQGILDVGQENTYSPYDQRESMAIKADFTSRLGGYSQTEFTSIAHSVIGSMFTKFKSFGYPRVINSVGSRGFNPNHARRTVSETGDVVYSAKNDSGYSRILGDTYSAFMKHSGHPLKAWNELSLDQKEKIRRMALVSFVFPAVFGMLANALFFDDDEDITNFFTFDMDKSNTFMYRSVRSIIENISFYGNARLMIDPFLNAPPAFAFLSDSFRSSAQALNDPINAAQTYWANKKPFINTPWHYEFI